jgi:hypothetical protein
MGEYGFKADFFVVDLKGISMGFLCQETIPERGVN